METLTQSSVDIIGILGIGGMLIYMTWPLTPAIMLVLSLMLFCKLRTLTSTTLWTIATSTPLLTLIFLKHLADTKTPAWIFDLEFFQQSYSQAYFLSFWIVFATVWGIVLFIIYQLYLKRERNSGLGIWR